MSDFKFSCPLCGQHISGDEPWSGRRINCPACQGDIVVPRIDPATPPAPPAPQDSLAVAAPSILLAPRVTTSTASPAHAPPPAAAPPPRRTQTAALPPPRRPDGAPQEGKSGKARAIITVAAIVVALGAVLYFVLPLINAAQDKLNAAREESARESDGGEVGHIATLNRVLDETDPARYEKMAAKEEALRKKEALRGRIGRAAAGSPAAEPGEAPLAAPSWTLDIETAKIPAGRVNGKISGADFLADDARLDVNGPLHVLTLRQGEGLAGDREILVSLHLKPGETIQGRNWTVAKDLRTGAPTVGKRWRADPKLAPQFKTFASGYAMKLEFVQASAGIITGKIYLALPDAEQTVVAGQFQADIRVAGATQTGRSATPSFDDQ